MKLKEILLLAGVLALDMLTKFWVQSTMTLGQSIPVIRGFFNITYAQNTGAAWSLLEGKMMFFYIITAVAVVGFSWYLWKTDKKDTWTRLATVLVIGVLCGIYSLFFAVEAYAYLTQLIAGAITVTLACQYAVQGFWQLCGIVLLNLSVLAVLHTLSETSLLAPGRLRSLAKLFSVATIAFVLLAGLKLGVYTLVYGWTLRRVLAVWALSVLAIGAGLAWVRLKQIIPAARWGILYALISFTLLGCFPLESWTGFLH